MLLIKAFMQFFLAALAVLIVIICIHVDVNISNNSLTEASVTEIVQESVLLLIVLIYVFLAWRRRTQRQCNVLIAGFFLSMLIRELDALFDLIAHGSWLWFALITAISSIAYSLRKPICTVNQLVEYTRSHSYGMLISGLLVILVFSRLFGMSMLWQNVLQDGYLRDVKNIVEEGTELFGYVLCLIASLNYAKDFSKWE